MVKKEDLFEGYVKHRKNLVGNFDEKVQASALLFNFFKNKGYKFYFCPKVIPEDQGKNIKRPDFHAHKDDNPDIIGEIKQSLPNPNGENYAKKSSKDIQQLLDYKGKLASISTPHDVFFAAPERCNEAISYYIQELEKIDELKDKVIVIKYFWTSGNSHSSLSLNRVYGMFSDNNIDKEFKYKNYQCGEGDLNDIQGYYKILYTEEDSNNTPIEYIMVVIWHNVIPELIKSADFDNTIERIRKGSNTLEFDIDEIKEVLDKIYILKSSETVQFSQFSKETLVRAMEGFEKINKAQRINDDKTNPKFRVTHTKISNQKKDLIEHLVRELNKENFEKRAEIEYNRLTNKDLRSIKTTDDNHKEKILG